MAFEEDPDDPSDDLPPGMPVGGLVVEALCGRGGFATIYRARHRTLGRICAVKVLHRVLSTSGSMLRRFEQEARTIARLSHPNIVDIHDFGELADGRPYFVMEWVDGDTLEDVLLAEGAQPLAAVLAVMEDVGGALAAAHEAGIVHRDIKASNVMRVRGTPPTHKLLDFGIAKLLQNDGAPSPSTTTGVRVGSPASMAPEQIRCDAVDARADVYALGVLVFQLLTGQLPFTGKSPLELQELHLLAAPPRPGDRVKVPPAVDKVVLRCLEKLPARRYAHAGELLAAFRAASSG